MGVRPLVELLELFWALDDDQTIKIQVQQAQIILELILAIRLATLDGWDLLGSHKSCLRVLGNPPFIQNSSPSLNLSMDGNDGLMGGRSMTVMKSLKQGKMGRCVAWDEGHGGHIGGQHLGL